MGARSDLMKQIMEEDDANMRGGPSALTPGGRGLPANGFSGAEERALHRDAGGVPPSRPTTTTTTLPTVESVRSRIAEKSKQGRSISNEDLY